MSTIDLLLLGLLGFAAWKGYKRGFMAEALATIALLVAIMAGFMLLDLGTDLVQAFFHVRGRWVPLAGFLLIVVGVVLFMKILGRIISGMVKGTIFGAVDSGLGALVGAIKACMSICIVVWGLGLIGVRLPEITKADSKVLPPVLKTGRLTGSVLLRLLPPAGELVDKIEQLFDKPDDGRRMA